MWHKAVLQKKDEAWVEMLFNSQTTSQYHENDNKKIQRYTLKYKTLVSPNILGDKVH